MKIQVEDLRAMSGVELFELAKKIVVQWFDHQKTKKKLGEWDDAIQEASEELWRIKIGTSKYESTRDLAAWIHGILRGKARANWQHLVALDEAETEGEIEDGELMTPTLFPSLSLDDLPSLTALDKLIIRHSTQTKIRQFAATKDIADLLGITTRAVRLRKEKLCARLRADYSLKIDIFAEQVQPELPHLTKKKEEKNPLDGFVPLATHFEDFRTFGIR